VRPFAQDFSEGGRTQQHFTESVDVNNIVAHYLHTGVDPFEERKKLATFGYATSLQFSEAMQNIAQVQSAFEELPADERKGFANDPGQWIDAMSIPDPTLRGQRPGYGLSGRLKQPSAGGQKTGSKPRY